MSSYEAILLVPMIVHCSEHGKPLAESWRYNGMMAS